MTDMDFIKSISNVPKRPMESVVKEDAFGRRAAKKKGGAESIAAGSQPVPPWQQEPDTPRASIGWVMGSGAEYMQHFKGWFTGLDEAAQHDFMQAHPEPESWNGFYCNLLKRG